MTNRRLFTYVVAFAIFVALEITLVMYIDKPLSLAFRRVDAAYPALIEFFRIYTDVGLGKWYVWPSGLGALLCAALLYRSSLTDRARLILQKARNCLAYLFVCTAGSGLLTNAIKPLVGRARPKLLQMSDTYGFHPLFFHSDWNSMPSGHSTTAFAVAFALAAVFPRARFWLLLFAVSIGLSRLMVNAHYLSDVLAGAFIGSLTALCTTYAFRKRGWLPPQG